jgi:predicted phage terminase large subunit-like protein
MDLTTEGVREAWLAHCSPLTLATVATRGRIRPTRHQEAIDERVCQLIERRLGPRILVVQAPPRHGKSELASVWLPAWFVGRWPDKSVAVTGYEARFAAKFGRRARDILEEHGPRLFGMSVDQAVRARDEWGITGRRGGCFTSGVGGPLTGRGFDLIVVDDVLKNSEQALSQTVRESHWDWWASTVLTRLEPRGVVVMVATRWHKDDLLGRVLRAGEGPDGEPVELLSLPALAGDGDALGRAPGEPLWPERWSRTHLERLRDSSDPYWFSALYQQNPGSHRLAEWSESLFGPHAWYDRAPDPASHVCRVLALDPSLGKTARSDFSAFVMLTTTLDGLVYVDASIERRSVTQMLADGASIANYFRPDQWAIETNAFGALEDLLYATWDGVLPPVATVTQHTDKVDRIRLGLGTLLSQGRLRLRRGSVGAERLAEQLQQFPRGSHDDGPDALEMGVRVASALDAQLRTYATDPSLEAQRS